MKELNIKNLYEARETYLDNVMEPCSEDERWKCGLAFQAGLRVAVVILRCCGANRRAVEKMTNELDDMDKTLIDDMDKTLRDEAFEHGRRKAERN